MKKFIIQVTLLLLTIGGGLLFFAANKNTTKLDIPFLVQSPNFITIRINETNLKVELADRPSKRTKGLAGRDSLASDEGMLFIFEREGSYPFWMKGLKFPLDFIWIKGEKIVDIMQNAPPPTAGQKDQDLPIYQSKEAVDKVLEVNGGTSDRLHIKVGDIVKIQ